MAGSSGFQFGRAPRTAPGSMTRRRLAPTRGRTCASACSGSTDDGDRRGARARRRDARGRCACATSSGSRPTVLAGVLPRLYPQMLEIAYDHQDAGRPVFICTAASQEMAELLAHRARLRRRRRLGLGGRRRPSTPGRAGGPFTYREGKAQAMRELAEREGIDLAASWAYSDSRVRPADAARSSAIRSRSTRTPSWRASRARRAGRSCASRRLGRRLQIAARGVAAALGGLGSWLARSAPPRAVNASAAAR